MLSRSLMRIEYQFLVSADYPSGQRGLTVNQLALPTGVRIPHLPPMSLDLETGRDFLF